ncbi:IPT/TIG domain-containing protein [Marinicella litoralis]|nr:IPT/TIG domain-containing protein [Marinicella litoralis]
MFSHLVFAGPPSGYSVSPQNGNTMGNYPMVISDIPNPSSVSDVMIGNQACSNVSVSGPNQITCLVPSGMGNHTVFVSSDTAQSFNHVTDVFSYDAPNIQVVAPNSIAQTGSETLNITGQNFGTSGTVLIGGELCQVLSYSHQSIDCVTPAGNGQNLSLVVMQADNKSDTLNDSISYIQCLPGTYNANGNCIPCDAGFYQDLTDQPSCKPCPTGTASNITGAAQCNACLAGTYNSQSGQAQCILCPQGQFQNQPGQSSCHLCAAGTANSMAGATACTACNPGEFAASSGQEFCLSCNEGTYQDMTGGLNCKVCGPGTYTDQTGQDSCTLCPAGRYQNDVGQNICYDCAAGSYSPFSGANECTLCPSGSFQSIDGATHCLSCPDSEIQPTEGQTQCLGPGQCDAVYGLFFAEFENGLDPVLD